MAVMYLSIIFVVFKVFLASHITLVSVEGLAVCPVAMDTVFLLDGSTSIGDSDFEKLKQFIIDVIQHFRISEQESHVGVVLYSDSPSTKVSLLDGQNSSSIYSKIRDMRFIGGNTHTDLGLNESRNVFITGGRQNVPRVLIVITDGESNGESVVSNAQRIRDDGITVLTLGVGSYVSIVELHQMATSYAHVHQFSSADEIGRHVSRIASAICAVSRKTQLYFTSISQDSVMVGHVIANVHVVDDVYCAFKCLNNEQCFSFDYMMTSGKCQLNYSTKRATPDDVIFDDQSIHYDMTFSLR